MTIVVGVKRWARWATFLLVLAAFWGMVFGKAMTAPKPAPPPDPCTPAIVLMSNAHDTVICRPDARAQVLQVWETTAQGVLVLAKCECNGNPDAGTQ